MRYITLSELIYINGMLLDNLQIMTGKQKVRDIALLDAAASRPATSAFGQDAYPTLREKVAALLHSIARNHPFSDGNKRTATVAAIFMLWVNGQRVAWEAEQALAVILDVAENRMDVAALAAWFPLTAGAAFPEADQAHDVEILRHILQEHRWLLDELNKR